MGNNLFGANISGKLATVLGSKLPAVSFRRTVAGARDPLHPSLGTNGTPTTYVGARGFVESFSQYWIGKQSTAVGQGIDTTVRADDRKLSVLGDTIPKALGQVVAGDEAFVDGKWRKVVGLVDRDPDAAMYTFHVR